MDCDDWNERKRDHEGEIRNIPRGRYNTDGHLENLHLDNNNRQLINRRLKEEQEDLLEQVQEAENTLLELENNRLRLKLKELQNKIASHTSNN